MSIDWREIQKRYDELSQELINPDLVTEKRLSLQKESSHLAQLLDAHNQIKKLEKTIEELEGQMAQGDDELALLFSEEIAEKKTELSQAHAELDDLLYPPDEHDNRSIYLEIRPGTGGQEAALFARDLVKMYTNYALLKNWKVAVESMTETDLGGIREVVLHIRGKGVFGALKQESGVHRVQRVPQTEGSGRVHTSTATVAVLPEAKEVDVTINPSDLRIDVYRASGAGGQHVNTTDSAVRITHVPTGVVVTCQDERSQHKNKAKALKMLKSRILMARKEASHAEMSQQRKEQVGSGMRSEKVRTYNFPQNRVTDHQVGLTLKKLDMVMQGDIEEIVVALQKKDREIRKNLQRSLVLQNKQ